MPDVGRLVVGVQRDRRLAVRTRLLQVGGRRRRRASLDDRPGPVHRIPRLGDHPTDANQVDRRVGVVERSLSRAISTDGGVEITPRVGMQLNLRLESHDVVGKHRDLGSEQLPVRLLRPRPLRGFCSPPPAPSQDQQAGGTGSAGEHQREHPARAAAVVIGVSAVAGTLGRTGGVAHALNEVIEHGGGVLAFRLERFHGQSGDQLPRSGPEPVADDDAECAGSIDGAGQLAGHFRGVATSEVGSRCRQDGDVDRCAGVADLRPQIRGLVFAQRSLGIFVDVDRVAPQGVGHLVEVDARRRCAGGQSDQQDERCRQSNTSIPRHRGTVPTHARESAHIQRPLAGDSNRASHQTRPSPPTRATVRTPSVSTSSVIAHVASAVRTTGRVITSPPTVSMRMA